MADDLNVSGEALASAVACLAECQQDGFSLDLSILAAAIPEAHLDLVSLGIGPSCLIG